MKYFQGEGCIFYSPHTLHIAPLPPFSTVLTFDCHLVEAGKVGWQKWCHHETYWSRCGIASSHQMLDPAERLNPFPNLPTTCVPLLYLLGYPPSLYLGDVAEALTSWSTRWSASWPETSLCLPLLRFPALLSISHSSHLIRMPCSHMTLLDGRVLPGPNSYVYSCRVILSYDPPRISPPSPIWGMCHPHSKSAFPPL